MIKAEVIKVCVIAGIVSGRISKRQQLRARMAGTDGGEMPV